MSDEPQVSKTPELPTHDGIVHSAKEFSDALTLELTDDEIKLSFEEVMKIKQKYNQKWYYKSWTSEDEIRAALDEFKDEVVTRMHGVGVLCTVDVTPILKGDRMIIEFIGKVTGGDFDKYGFDHEKKEWEVKRSVERDEDYYGQKGITKKKKS